jgi:excisionase family DNA binding protein
MNEPLMTPREAAASAGVSPSLVYQWCRDQLLPHYRFGTQGRRGKILIAPSDLEAFMQQCRVERHVLLDDLE